MALHRDIFWVGRQWAVTGAGIQAVDQRLRGVLDIAIARLWDDDLVLVQPAGQARRECCGFRQGADRGAAQALYRRRRSRTRSSRQLEALGVIEAPVVSLVVPAMKLRAEGRLARFLPQWRIRRLAGPGWEPAPRTQSCRFA